MKEDEIRKVVREGYAEVAKKGNPCCAPANPCCGGTGMARNISKSIGYTDEDLGAVPDGANLGLGCGNPIALASLKGGEVVLDLGSGAGFDCFLAANKVGSKGRVIGVDMTPEMLASARENARKGGYENVEFRLGEIENLPVADNSVDVVISNCVINLSPDKRRVFREAFRALKPGGRLMVSDIVLLKELPEAVRNSMEAYVGCLAGASMKPDYLQVVKDAGFTDIRIVDEACFPIELMANDPTAKAVIDKSGVTIDEIKEIGHSVASVKVQGTKPH